MASDSDCLVVTFYTAANVSIAMTVTITATRILDTLLGCYSVPTVSIYFAVLIFETNIERVLKKTRINLQVF